MSLLDARRLFIERKTLDARRAPARLNVDKVIASPLVLRTLSLRTVLLGAGCWQDLPLELDCCEPGLLRTLKLANSIAKNSVDARSTAANPACRENPVACE